MTADMRAMLDELMGRDRNLSLVEKEKQMEHWSDPVVCKYHLVKFCPHDLFTNTRADLGPCKFTTHDVKIRETYRTSQRWKTMGYETKFLRFLEGIVDDMERKIKKQHERLEHDERYMKAEQEKADEERNSRLEELNKDIDEMLEKMAEAGSVGNVDEAQEMMKQVETMRQERETIKSAKVEEPGRKVFLVKQNVPFINEMKHMEVCPICGAFLVVNDTQTRVDAHLTGKQHVGYAMIREAISELREEREKELKEQDEKRAAQVAEREKDKKEQEESVKKEVVAKDNERRDGGAEGSKDKEVSRTRERSRDKTRERSKDKPKPLRGASIERERSRRDAERFQKLMKYEEARGPSRSSFDRRDRDSRKSKECRSRSRDRRSRDRGDRSRDGSRKSSKEDLKSDSQTDGTAKKTGVGESSDKVVVEEEKEDKVESPMMSCDENNIKIEDEGEQTEFEKSSEGPGKAEDLIKNEDRNNSDAIDKTTSRRSNSREKLDRSRDRSSRKSRERPSRKSRDMSRDRSHRDRSRERKRRSRSRDRRRSRSYERKRSRN